mmetsp:Transcript_36287/g.50400  ORF Transcript_36287/g.50400 Transcript_36287/m.50400 type:complete len:236 (-) Transcript_36287:156-863(-)|eukprot:CAMPEP_0196580372 /NCGR_PEP_ID=MMETSP1081-20130531/28588_1 /TAXON_ID=36882 /ORGANISM="Pyramimonas amylifera, Strain CCMP720" /LENGTH=235 /DNA_ID=CAMNT_0041900223 /DNA_START=147 /DNA_END=854 /DNA_ORIENTATION=+
MSVAAARAFTSSRATQVHRQPIAQTNISARSLNSHPRLKQQCGAKFLCKRQVQARRLSIRVRAAEMEEETEIVQVGTVSKYLARLGLKHKCLGFDYQGLEIVQARREDLLSVAAALYSDGWNYLRNTCGYDNEPGGDLVSVYHLAKMDPNTNDDTPAPEEMCLKVFLPRDDPRCPTVFWIWQTADWQERETYDMYGIIYEGHPKLTRVLNPEHWEGWPLRKDYVTPDFYELQDAY